MWVRFEKGAVPARRYMFCLKGRPSAHLWEARTFHLYLRVFLPSLQAVRAAVLTVVKLLFKYKAERCSSSFAPNKETVQYQRHKWSDNYCPDRQPFALFLIAAGCRDVCCALTSLSVLSGFHCFSLQF